MFLIKSNKEIGTYLDSRIKDKFPSRREFGKQYLIARGEEPTEEAINRMSNRLTQIVKGNKAIQLEDLPYFTGMLEVSCEQILSAGEFAVPLENRVTNYSVACSRDPQVWEEYVHREDRLILNSDEYGRTVLDYALESGNYDFLKFLMDQGYIWFDSGNRRDYVYTFGAGTSIERRRIGEVDCGLESELRSEDALRERLIELACDNRDLSMLEKLRAREHPQLYWMANYQSFSCPDFGSHDRERLVSRIAASGEEVLGYFTEPFKIPENIDYRDGTKRSHTFLFPYISQLLDLLVAQKSAYAEIAIKKAIRHNRETYEKLRKLIALVKNDPNYSAEFLKELRMKNCRQGFMFEENGSIVIYRALYPDADRKYQSGGIITNVPQVTRQPESPEVRARVEELRESYLNIRNIMDHLEEI